MVNVLKFKFFRIKILNKTLIRFIFFGAFNTIFTNLILQVLLYLVPTIIATLASQIFNFSFGFYFYGKNVFGIKYFKKSFFIRYLFLNILIWNLNWILINTINFYNISKNIASLLVIPFLALISFGFQKTFVFLK